MSLVLFDTDRDRLRLRSDRAIVVFPRRRATTTLLPAVATRQFRNGRRRRRLSVGSVGVQFSTLNTPRQLSLFSPLGCIMNRCRRRRRTRWTRRRQKSPHHVHPSSMTGWKNHLIRSIAVPNSRSLSFHWLARSGRCVFVRWSNIVRGKSGFSRCVICACQSRWNSSRIIQNILYCMQVLSIIGWESKE